MMKKNIIYLLMVVFSSCVSSIFFVGYGEIVNVLVKLFFYPISLSVIIFFYHGIVVGHSARNQIIFVFMVLCINEFLSEFVYYMRYGIDFFSDSSSGAIGVMVVIMQLFVFCLLFGILRRFVKY